MKLEIDENLAKEIVKRIAGKMALKILGEVKRQTPVVTGIARNSVFIKEERLAYFIGTSLNYWNVIEDGSVPHEIVPKLAKALRFEVESEFVFAKKVRHPGTEGKHIFEKIANNHTLLEKFLTEAINETI